MTFEEAFRDELSKVSGIDATAKRIIEMYEKRSALPPNWRESKSGLLLPKAMKEKASKEKVGFTSRK